MDWGRFQSSAYSSPSLTTHRRGQERRQVILDADGPGAGPSAAVRRREGLVQVEVADVEAEVAGARDAEDGVEVGAVHVDLHALGVAHLGDLVDLRLEEAERIGLGDHEGRDVVGQMPLEVEEVHVAVGLALELRRPSSRRAPSRPGLVPCAESGISTLVRRSPLAR